MTNDKDIVHALAHLQVAVGKWTQYNFPNTKSHQPLLGVQEEVGELAHAHLKMEQGIRTASKSDKGDAVGDIVIYLVDYCNQNGLDFASCVAAVWAEVRERDWVKYPKNGRSE